MSELVTGEAVALELRPAKLPSRALAVLLDLVVAVFAYLVVIMALAVSTASMDEAAQVALSIASFLLVLVGGPIAVETLSHGRSLGKLAFGLRVVRDDGGPIRFRHALVRGAVGVIEILATFGVVACVASLVSARGRRLGDVFAGTLVVRERIPVGRTGFVPPPPPWLVGRFAGLDLSAVPDGLWLAVRQYLTRMPQLDPQVSTGMAQRLAADLAARTGTSAPADLPPAAFLAAVMHERQSREARKAFGGGFTSPAGQPGGPVGYQPQAVRPFPASHQPPADRPPGTAQSPGTAHSPNTACPPQAAHRPSVVRPPYSPPAAGPQEWARQPEVPAAPPVAPARDEPAPGRPATGFAPPA